MNSKMDSSKSDLQIKIKRKKLKSLSIVQTDDFYDFELLNGMMLHNYILYNITIWSSSCH